VRHSATARQEYGERREMNMNKTWLGIIGLVVVIVVVLWLLGGSSISCHESFWDKDKQVIEIEH
jgi:type VI protein secretion system component VasK